MKRQLSPLLFILLLSNCQSETNTVADEALEKEKVKKFYSTWVREFMVTRKPDDYFKNVTEEFVLMGCGFEPITSRDTIRADLEKFDKDIEIEIADMQTKEIILRDDIAIHRYSCFEVLRSKSDTAVRRIGFNFLDVLKKDKDDNWKMHLHLAIEKQ